MRSRASSDIAAMEGKKIGLDGVMTVLSFILLFIIVVIPNLYDNIQCFFLSGKI